jgi:hypothetical protein
MSTLRTALAVAGLGAMVFGAGAPAASANGAADTGRRPGQDDATSFGFSVSPRSVQPGGAVDLTVTGCTESQATAESAVFDRIALGTPGDIQSARTTVDADAQVGAQYEIVFTCGGETGTAVLTIVDATATPTPTTTATATETATATTSATAQPTLGAQAGVGGSQSGGSGGGTMLIAGAGITALALTGGVLAFRRRPGRHG